DYATKSFFTYTFSVMDDKTEEFLDYTPKGGNFTDCENSCLPFEIPYYVFEYVTEKTSKTTGVSYITNSKNGTAKITGYVGNDTDVIIPSYVSDGNQAYKITEISSTAFSGKSVRSIVLGEFIKSIPDGAFKNCTQLEEVIGSFTEIGNEAFAGCNNLTNMNIPSNVVKIGTNAFFGANSVKVRAINSLSAYAEAVKALPDGTDDQIKKKQKEITQEYIRSVLNCGAQNIVLDLSYIADGTSLTLEVPEIESIEINGGTKTYNDFNIDSSARETTLNNMTINSNHGTPMMVNSDKLTLYKVFVSGNNSALIMKKDGAVLSLVQDSAIEANAKYSVIGKNLTIESQISKDGAAGYLNVTGDFGYVNSITGEDYVAITDGKFVEISEDEFNKYCQGVFTVNFNANEGTVTYNSKTVVYGSTLGTLPTPKRDYYDFDGWFTADDGGEEVTADTIFTSTEDVTYYAHWTIHSPSDWVKASEMPENAVAVNTKYSYTQRSYTTSGSSSMSGWTKYDTKRTSWGGTQGPVYYDPNNGSRNVWSEQYVASQTTHYVYYHRYKSNQWSDDAHASSWARHQGPDVTSPLPNGYYSQTTGQRYSGDACSVCGKTNQWHLDYTYTTDNYGTRWYYQEPVYTYYYYKDENKESTTNPTGQSNVSNVQEWVQYRVK
ncbi:MAG: leucine-rich repeat protein, partial [Ruminococcus sp.]|nr:leucine-rich repeat protein [Ruminococcus sp.]